MSHTDIEALRKSVRTYLFVFGALMVLTLVTVLAFFVHLAVPVAITVALLIATIKGSLVASFFMHLAHERKLIYWSLILTVAFFIFLMFLPLMGLVDQIPGTRSTGVSETVSRPVH
jgi:cytochrome c oxidase subunit 4